jgi:phage gp46-like protein
MAIEITIVDQTIQSPNLLWDTTWDGTIGDWAPAAPTEPSNQGGLRARAPLHTAILICLMSDMRAGPNDIIPDGSGDPRGWAGDPIDPDIPPLGSKLWLLRRRELTQEVADLAVIYARQCWQPLIRQGAVASIDVKPTIELVSGRLRLDAKFFKQDGAEAVAMNFAILWDSSNGIQRPLAP